MAEYSFDNVDWTSLSFFTQWEFSSIDWSFVHSSDQVQPSRSDEFLEEEEAYSSEKKAHLAALIAYDDEN